MVFSIFATRGAVISTHPPPLLPLQDSLWAASWFLDLEWNLLYLCKIFHWSPVRERGCSLEDAISVLFVSPSFCPCRCWPPLQPRLSGLDNQRTITKSPKQSRKVVAKLKPPLPKPTSVSHQTLAPHLSFFFFCFDICSFSLPESNTEDTKGFKGQKHLGVNMSSLWLWGTTLRPIEYSITLGR